MEWMNSWTPKISEGKALPLEIGRGTREMFESMGIIFGQPFEHVAVEVTLPHGWRVEHIANDFQYRLKDNKNRVRAEIQCEPAAYQRSARLIISQRFWPRAAPLNVTGENDPRWLQIGGDWVGQVTDDFRVVWQSEPHPIPDGDRETSYIVKNYLHFEAARWLDKNYPDWKNPEAYWD